MKCSGDAPLAVSESSTVENSPSIEFPPSQIGEVTDATNSHTTQITTSSLTVAKTSSPQLRRHKIMPKSPLAAPVAVQQHETLVSKASNTSSVGSGSCTLTVCPTSGYETTKLDAFVDHNLHNAGIIYSFSASIYLYFQNYNSRRLFGVHQ
jgi:hypothetical protein